MEVEEEYLDVLQNIEAVIMEVYRDTPALLDYDVGDAIAALTRHYVREERGQQPPPLRLSAQPQRLFDAVKEICEWHLGKQALKDERGEEVSIPPIPLADLIRCLRRLEKSIQRWTKEGGRQGYLTFVSRFFR